MDKESSITETEENDPNEGEDEILGAHGYSQSTPMENIGARPKKLTQKGLQFWRENKEQEIEELFTELLKHSTVIKTLMKQNRPPATVREHYANWLNTYDILFQQYDKYSEMFSPEDHKEKEEFSQQFTNLKEFKTLVETWFQNCSTQEAQKSEINPEDSASNTGKSVASSSKKSHKGSLMSSRHSSVSSAKLKEKTKKAELLTKASMLKKKQQLELEQLKLKMRQEELDLTTEIAIAEAKSQVLEEFDEDKKSDVLSQTPHSATATQKVHVTNKVTKPPPDTSNATANKTKTNTLQQHKLNPSAPTYVPKTTPYQRPDTNELSDTYQCDTYPPTLHYSHPPADTSNQDQSGNQDFVTSMVRHIRKPAAEISKFTGDPLTYQKFIRQFYNKVVTNSENDDERMGYLEQFTTGDANKVVTGFSYLPASQGYQAALQELEERYGDQEVIASAYIKKAINWPVIKADNAKALDDFAIFLVECENATRSIEAVRILQYSENLKLLVAKLPYQYHDKWRNIVEQTKAKKEAVKFEQLVQFVKKEARKANDPTFGREAMKSDRPTTGKPQSTKGTHPRNKGSFHAKNLQTESQEAAGATEKEPSGNNNSTGAQHKASAFSIPCMFCESDSHCLDSCQKLSNLPYEDKIQFLKTKGMCFGCLRRGHQRKDCRLKLTCRECNRPHPTMCHMDAKDFDLIRKDKNQSRPDKQEQLPSKKSTSAFTNLPHGMGSYMGAGESTCRMAIIPVKAKMKSSSKTVETYAFLYPGSSVSFCTESLMKQIGGTGRKMNITIDTMGEPYSMNTFAVNGIEICNLQSDVAIELPKVYTKSKMPVTHEHIPSHEDIKQWPHLKNLPVPKIKAEVGLLIGNNVPDVYSPVDIKTGPSGSPHATKTRLGWILWNVASKSVTPDASRQTNNNLTVNKVTISAISEMEQLKKLDQLVRESINRDFPEKAIGDKKEDSVEDKRFRAKVNDSIRLIDGHYQIGLPFKNDSIILPDSKKQALQRLKNLEKKMNQNEKFAEDYREFMAANLAKGYAEIVPDNELERKDNKIWYLPHHGIYHPKKPNKIRVVFDCSAVYEGVSFNELLLQGPDLTNSLFGVLLRFRKDNVAVMGDIEGMFNQVKVPKEKQDLQRFLWWPSGATSKEPKTYRMVVHLFGAVCSPSIANTALRQTAQDNASDFNPVVSETILRNFYVDDCLTSAPSKEEACRIIKETKQLCAKGGFNLTKWVSNDTSVLESVPVEERAKGIKSLDLGTDTLPGERALGVYWCLETDCLGFKIVPRQQSPTRRSVLFVISSVYDPLGLAAPFILTARLILRELCQQHSDWDEELSGENLKRWNRWQDDLPKLESITIPRCYQPAEFGQVTSRQIHTFSDASDLGYGTVSYLRLENANGDIHCSLLAGKSRVAPLKTVTIPRLELTAATLAVRISKTIVQELDYRIDQVFFWTDSMSVLRYIANDKSRFHTFVANRIGAIREATELNQWGYVDSKTNPADIASRGADITKFTEEKAWHSGPNFLWKDQQEWPTTEMAQLTISNKDPEIKKKVMSTVSVANCETMNRLLNYHSSWLNLKTTVAWILVAMANLKQRVQERKAVAAEIATRENDPKRQELMLRQELSQRRKALLEQAKDGIKRNISTHKLEEAEHCIIKYLQKKHFHKEIDAIQNAHTSKKTGVLKSSPIKKLDPIIKDGVLRVGGRLGQSNIQSDAKHQILLPKSRVSELILQEVHAKVGHLGKNAMLSNVRQKFWILGANTTIKQLTSKCVICRKYQMRKGQQKMADLPPDRIHPGDPPFTHVAIDYFGPFLVRIGRSRVKRYGVVFTCLTVRAVHLEIAHSLDTDSCINAIRRFLSRRGPVKTIRSDNGTNLVGSERELREELNSWNQTKIGKVLARRGIDWKFNPPAASHFGGIWERIIRSVRKILYSLFQQQTIKMNDEGLHTAFCEVEAILNDRPITTVPNSPNDVEALTPNHLLTLRGGESAPPGIFEKSDNFVQRKWRRVQYIADVFWRRWVREYLPMLQERQKWNDIQRNLQVGDIVLLVDVSPRNSWSLGRVITTFKDQKGFIRSADVKTANSVLRRSIDKLCVILEMDSV